MNETKNPNIVIDISDIDTKAIEKSENFLQEDAFSDLILFLEKDLNKKIKKNQKYYNQRTHNAIFINGLRGSGKTQFLLSIKNYIRNESKKNKKLQNIYFFNPIDPTLLHDNESFLTIIIAKILNNLENNNKLDKLDTDEKKSFYSLLASLSKAIDGVVNNTNKNKTALETIAQDQTSLKLEEYMHRFFYKIKKIVGKKKLVILIDDIDMALDKGFEVLEVLRKYLASPYIIPIITGNENLYHNILENHFDKYSKTQEEKEQFAIDYLIKVLPMHRRLKIKTIYELSLDRKIEFTFNNNTYLFKCFKCTKTDEENYFYTQAQKVFEIEEFTKVFVKNLFSNSLRKIIQFLNKEHKNNNNDFAISTLEEIEKLEKKYYLTLLKDVKSWKTYLEEGNKFFKKNDWEQAIHLFKKSIELKKTEEVYYLLGNSYFNLLAWEDAEYFYNKVLDFNENNSEALFKRGGTYRKRNLYNEAIQDYKKSIQINPDYDEAYNHIGICYLHINNVELAIKNFKKAIELNPKSPKPYINIIETSFLTNKLYYTKEFEKDFIKQFKDTKNIMQSFDMFKILELVQNGENNDILNSKFDEWVNKYNGIKHPDWSFIEIEMAIKKRENKEVQLKLNEYLKLFKEYM